MGRRENNKYPPVESKNDDIILNFCQSCKYMVQLFFHFNLGICDENYEDVIQCLEMDLQEKLAIVAGKQLFFW